MFKEYDVVVLKKPLSDSARPSFKSDSTVPVGSQGTIVLVHSTKDQAYEVEFFDQNDDAIDTFTVVGDEYLELKWAYKDTE
jgi:hypothetical protein